jgi:hypothetical protein
MASATATRAGTRNEMVWEDPVVTDELFGNVVRNLFWTGFLIMALSRLVLGILSVTFYFDIKNAILAGSSARATWPGSLDTMVVVQLFDTIGTLVFSGALVAAALVVSRMPSWARVTLLGVAAVVLVGSNALAGFSLTSLALLRR